MHAVDPQGVRGVGHQKKPATGDKCGTFTRRRERRESGETPTRAGHRLELPTRESYALARTLSIQFWEALN